MPTQRQEISASIQANFPDNVTQFITPARLRTEQGLFENYAVLNEQTASIIAEAVTSASVSAGSVTTASFNAFTASTNTFTQSIQTQVNALEAATGSYVTNAQTSSMSVATASVALSALSASTVAVIEDNGNTSHKVLFVATSSNGEQLLVDPNDFTYNPQQNLLTVTASYSNFAVTASYAQNAGTTVDTGSLLVTASATLNTITFTKGDASTFAVTVDTGSGGGTIDTGSFATTGSNVFNGTQTLSSSTIPASLILNASSSLSTSVVQSGNSTTLEGANIIINRRTSAAATGSIIVSGSSNIIFTAGNTTTSSYAGFNNIGVMPVTANGIPVMSGNYIAGTLTMSGSRVSANTNNIVGTITVNFTDAAATASFAGNYVNATTALVTSSYSGSGVSQTILQSNNIAGASHRIEIIGTGSQARQFTNNFIGGNINTASLSTPTGSIDNSGSLFNTLIFGNGLIISGSQIATSTLHGGAFVGRYNATASIFPNVSSSLASSKDIIFAVGAGTSNTARKTPLYVSASGLTVLTDNAYISGTLTIEQDTDTNAIILTQKTAGGPVWSIANESGTNTATSIPTNATHFFRGLANSVYQFTIPTVVSSSFTVTGSVNITGSQVITGSLRGQVSALTVASNTASLNLSTNNFFTLQLVSGSNVFINPSNILPGQTVNLLINTTGSGTVSFPSTVKQVSGSSYVPTTTTGVDIVTFISFDSSSLYLSNVKNLV